MQSIASKVTSISCRKVAAKKTTGQEAYAIKVKRPANRPPALFASWVETSHQHRAHGFSEFGGGHHIHFTRTENGDGLGDQHRARHP